MQKLKGNCVLDIVATYMHGYVSDLASWKKGTLQKQYWVKTLGSLSCMQTSEESATQIANRKWVVNNYYTHSFLQCTFFALKIGDYTTCKFSYFSYSCICIMNGLVKISILVQWGLAVVTRQPFTQPWKGHLPTANCRYRRGTIYVRISLHGYAS